MLRPPSALQAIVRAVATIARHRELGVVLACNVILGLAVSFVMPFLSVFGTEEVGMSLFVFGVFTTGTTASSILIATLLAHRSDREGSRRGILLLGSAAGFLGYAGYAFVREVWLLFIIGALVLGVASVTFPQLFAYARERLEDSDLPPAEWPLYMNTLRMFVALAWTAGPAVAAWTLQALGFRGVMLGASFCCLVLFVVIAVFVPAAPLHPRVGPASDRPPPASLASSVRNPAILGWFVALTLVFAAQAMSMMNLPLLVLKVLHGTESHVGVMFTLAPCFELPFMLYLGVLATRIEHGRLIHYAVGVAVIYYGVLAVVGAPWHIYPLQVLSAATVSVTSGVAMTFFQDKVPGQAGAAMNVFASAQRLGSTSGYLLFGGLASQFGHRGVYVACMLLCVAALALTIQRPTRIRAPAH